MVDGFDYILKARLRHLASSSVEHQIQDHVRFEPNGPQTFSVMNDFRQNAYLHVHVYWWSAYPRTVP